MKVFQKTMYYSMLCMALIFTACNKDDSMEEEEQGGANTSEFFTAKVDGADFAASNDPATLIGGQKNTANGSTVLTCQGSTNDGNAINFNILDYNGPGTYTTGDALANPNLIQYLEINPVAGWGSNLDTAAVGGLRPGSIEITKDENGVVEGTFSFEGYNADDMTTKNVTEGRFKVVMDN